jgi:hypothetical protein
MSTQQLTPGELRLTVNPAAFSFASTAELVDLPLPWIGLERAEAVGYPAESVLGLAQKTLMRYRQACEALGDHPGQPRPRKFNAGRPPRP